METQDSNGRSISLTKVAIVFLVFLAIWIVVQFVLNGEWFFERWLG